MSCLGVVELGSSETTKAVNTKSPQRRCATWRVSCVGSGGLGDTPPARSNRVVGGLLLPLPRLSSSLRRLGLALYV